MNSASMRVAIVGGATLKGRELADLLKDRNFPARDVRLLDDDESLGQLETMGDEVTFVQSVNRAQFENVDIAFLASDENYARKNWKIARDAGCAIVDLSYALEDEPRAAVRAPWVDRELGRVPAPELQPAPAVIAHPAAILLGMLLLRAARASALRAAVATVMEPASEHGRRGLDELHEQTVNLLSFKELPKQVFDEQVTFNMVARLGAASQPALEATEQRISRHLSKIAGGQTVAPSLMLVQGPTFHAHVMAVHVDLERAVELAEFTGQLHGEHIAVALGSGDFPSNVNAAGQNDILVAVRRDPQRDSAFWIWAAADNLRVVALNAIDCAANFAVARPKGQVQ